MSTTGAGRRWRHLILSGVLVKTFESGRVPASVGCVRETVRCGIRRVRGLLVLSTQLAQNVVEYGLLIATIVVVVLIGTMAFGNEIGPWFNTLAGRITTNS